ncbi:lipoyltransferase 1, mitochondrial isoform X2 [Nilaparvata lugens]|uniref:lipoyltransferase 1, mitochondrial isoform X2 n=1 Tax=Nilaparvata lugens TaxID=108931 RepID=UPI00193E4E18|nr:lipoyltransferase 1, mitochondrial isoform X2 [Nilaparvata lugens]
MVQILFHPLKLSTRILSRNNSKTLLLSQECTSARLVSNMPVASSKVREVENDENKIVKSVYISQSKDIFTNLALEDWMYKNFDFSKQHILLLWKNDPCVVIGRNQNPWLEANLDALSRDGVEVARRSSGGGTVYHDNGNLNLTFFTPREHYNRRRNLDLVSNALKREWAINAEINQREDMVVDGVYKISGTASKLGRPNAYHHCTLLVDVNQSNLREALRNKDDEIKTNATKSIPSPTKNLSQMNPSISVGHLLNAVGWEYLRRKPMSLEDGGSQLISRQNGFQLVNPTDDWFPGLAKIRDEFESWDWRYGQSPKFSISKAFPLPAGVCENSAEQLTVKVDIEKGLVQDVVLHVPHSLMNAHGLSDGLQILSSMKGRRFSEEALEELDLALRENHHLKDFGKVFVADCMRKMVASA